MTMRDLSILRTLFLLIGLFGALSCSNTQSNSDYDPSIDFAGLKTFAWLPDQPQGRTRVLHTNGLRLVPTTADIPSQWATRCPAH